ncbi:MAG: Si-specific NAD(P)(+) transhydrogenase [Deltaproteobacteria bacterium]|nr:Si-specific NAD(P)(+) transhydrogenase [Deltaproteobacteria bacterium]
MEPTSYDLVVIGSGPAGQKGAIAAAKMGKRVAVIDRYDMLGGVCLHAGTIPSKTLRLAVLYLTGFQQKSFYGQAYSPKSHVTVDDLMFRVRTVVEREQAQITDQLQRNDVTLVNGWARFVDPHTLQVEDGHQVRGDHILIACGTRSARDPEIPYDGRKVMLAEDLGSSGHGDIPRRVIVVGAGVIGLEYASMLSALGVRVTLIESRDTMLDFVDREIIEALRYHMRRRDAIFRLGEHVTGVRIQDNGLVRAELESGKRVTGDALLYTVGRQSNADQLGLDRIGIDTDARGRVTVNENFQTVRPHIYAVGDCIGFPALASTSMEQGRLASTHMFDGPSLKPAPFFPYGIYSIPEISMVGRTEQELTAERVPYEVGKALYEDVSKAQMVGDRAGMLKLIFDPDTLKLLSVHAIGEEATEIIHIGHAVIALGGTIEYFRDNVFNYPTFAEAYKVAAYDGFNKIAEVR